MMEVTFDPRLEELRERERQDNIPLVIVVVIILLLGVIGNTVAFVFYGFKEKRSVNNFFIAVLALNDLITNLVFFDELYVHFNQFKFTNTAGCKILYVVNNWVLMNSVSLMLVIAVERYRKIRHPFSWQFTNLSARVATVCVTVTTLVVCSKEAIFAEIVPEHILMNDNSTVEGYVCVHSHDKKLKPFINGSNIFTLIIYVSLFLSIIVSYCLIIYRIYKLSKANSGNRQDTSRSNDTPNSNSSSNGTNIMVETNTAGNASDSNETSSTNTEAAQDEQNINGLPIDSDIEMGSIKLTGISASDESRNIADGITCSTSQSEGQTSPAEVTTKIMPNCERRSEPSNKLVEVENRITKMVIVIAIASILSFVPYFLVILLVPSHNSTEDQLSNMKKKVFRESYKLNGVINPFIMCIFSSNFRQFIKGLFCRCCTKK